MVSSSGDVEGVDVTEPTPVTHGPGTSNPAPPTASQPTPPASAPLRCEVDPLTDTDPTGIHWYELVGRVPGSHASDVYLAALDGTYRVLKLAPSATSDSHSSERFARELRNAESGCARRVSPRSSTAASGRVGPTWCRSSSTARRSPSCSPRPTAVRWTPGTLRELATGIGEALLDLQRAEVVHRDVTPSNVLVHPDRGAVLVDFGISRAELDPGLTSVGVAVGTPGYMSPEQLRGERTTNASDVFQWGLVVGQALLGHHPVEGVLDTEGHLTEHWAAALVAARTTDALREHAGRLGRLVANALDPDPDIRPAAAALLADIDRTSLSPVATESLAIPYVPEGLSATPARLVRRGSTPRTSGRASPDSSPTTGGPSQAAARLSPCCSAGSAAPCCSPSWWRR